VTVYEPTPAPTLSPSATTVTAGVPFALSGSGVAGATVTIYDGAAVIGTATVGAGGTWSFTVTLAVGAHDLSVVQTDPVSHFTSAASPSVTVTAYVRPPAPVITSVSTPAGTRTTTPVVVSGTGTAGDTVTLSDRGTVIGTTTVGGGGTWSLTVSLGVGAHVLTATQSVVPNVTSLASGARTVTVYRPTPVPTISILAPFAPPSRPPAPSVSATTVAAGTAVTLSGSGVAGDTITIRDGRRVIGTTKVGANGTWTFRVVLAKGRHSLTAVQSDRASRLASLRSRPVTVVAYARPSAPVIKSVTTQAGKQGAARVTVSGKGTAGDTIKLYDGRVVIGTTKVGKRGTWSLTVKLRAGTHVLTATQTVAANVTSLPSARKTITIESRRTSSVTRQAGPEA
jgi:cytochrome c5